MGRIPYLPLGQGGTPTAEILREQPQPTDAGSEFAFPVSDTFTVRRPAGCPSGSHAVQVYELIASGNRYCAPGPGPARLPGELLDELKTTGIVVVVLAGVLYALVLIGRGVRASKEPR